MIYATTASRHALEPEVVHGFELTCWNGDAIRGAFLIDAHDREIIAWRAVANAGISGSDVRDMMLEAVENQFGAHRAPHPVEMLSDNGSSYTGRDARIFASQFSLHPCFTPVKSPESNGLPEAFVDALKRDYVLVTPLPDAQDVLDLVGGWIEDHNDNHPHATCAHPSSSSQLKPQPPECPTKRGQDHL